MYPWLIFLHIVGTFGFVMAHGVSAAVAFRLRKERGVERVRALLEISGGSYSVLYPSLYILLITGIVGGFMGKWWGAGWIWTSLGLLIALIVYMSFRAAGFYGGLRKAAGLEFFEKFKAHPPIDPVSAEELERMLSKSIAWELLVVGSGGLAAILWLMMFKPF
ncbi:MAG: hypothetical protein HY784_12445 [Chloroflexi bacterium]|nr:hypothetical protein [Chloroflexota bacterium]